MPLRASGETQPPPLTSFNITSKHFAGVDKVIFLTVSLCYRFAFNGIVLAGSTAHTPLALFTYNVVDRTLTPCPLFIYKVVHRSFPSYKCQTSSILIWLFCFCIWIENSTLNGNNLSLSLLPCIFPFTASHSDRLFVTAPISRKRSSPAPISRNWSTTSSASGSVERRPMTTVYLCSKSNL